MVGMIGASVTKRISVKSITGGGTGIAHEGAKVYTVCFRTPNRFKG